MTVVSVRATRQRVAARARRRELSVVTSRAKIRPGSSRSQQVLPDLDALSVAQQAVEHGNADSINNGRVAHAAKSGANRHGPLSPRRLPGRLRGTSLGRGGGVGANAGGLRGARAVRVPAAPLAATPAKSRAVTA